VGLVFTRVRLDRSRRSLCLSRVCFIRALITGDRHGVQTTMRELYSELSKGESISFIRSQNANNLFKGLRHR